jgi:hypothetical protein
MTGGHRSIVVSQARFEATYGVTRAELRAWLKKVNNTPEARSLIAKAGRR